MQNKQIKAFLKGKLNSSKETISI